MRKKNAYIFCTLLAILLVSGCGNSKNAVEQQPDITTVDREKIAYVSYGMSEYTTGYSDLASMAEASDLIIYGEIENIDYVMEENGYCVSNLDVNVIQTIKGDVQEGDIVKVSEDQGMVTIQDYLDSYADDGMRDEMRKGYTEYSDDQLDDYYIVKLGQGDIMAEKGQKSIYLLQESAFYDTENTYCRITGAAGSYTEVTEGGFTNTQTVGNILTAKDDMNVTLLSNDENGPFPTQTLDELVAEMNL